MKLSKTEQLLLDRAKDTGRSGVTIGYRTGTKRGLWGGRESDALAKLVKKGLVRIVSQESRVDSGPRYSDHTTDTVYELVKTCGCMTEDPGDGLGERVVTHSLGCPQHPEHA